jgi:hypothetical protein
MECLHKASGSGFVTGTLTGYFHFISSSKGRAKDVFDPGPYELDVTHVAVISIEQNRK